ncbi:nucleotidyltransferase [Epilithonimonas arachidiradicis]|uniref:Nucleotidyltransferase n=1 Tax=Epilithonimonas arachidiradicis TaxID=1617282 RepID=A0A420DDI5_9FLAO|nr:nucleotidyltransferase [Epilithonimonas arachidiradicis]RKE89998.1 hypothetical protein BXY58_0583 [Epilithonimonas arachidiradicis]GGG46933.1 hypothetical protein GCM10007332_05580 [Epilithonimonas arachidiradicis]
MARSVETIYSDLVAKKEADERLNALNSTSKVAIWRLWLWVFAYGSWVLETIFDKHQQLIEQLLSLLKPHTLRWYRNKVLQFQYGFDLIEDTDVFNNGSATDEEIAASKIIKYAAVTESTTESRLIVKIATEDGSGVLAPIPDEVYPAFSAYMEEIKDAGVKITVINYLPDILKLLMTIYYDPLLLTADGVSIRTGRKPVEDALKEFMKELPFNGELILASLIDKLQATEGIKIPHLVNAQSKWIANNGVTYGNFENISVKKIPTSGYFQIENFDNISYVAYS